MVSLIAALLLAVLPDTGRAAKPRKPVGRVAEPVVLRTATLHFSGLVLFTPQSIANSRRVIANHDDETIVGIMPDTAYVPHVVHTDHGIADTYTEDHTAVIAFSDKYPVQAVGWQVAELKPGLSYVALRGERISFEVDSVNPPTKYKDITALPDAGGNTIGPAYLQAPGAAAIFDIPRAKKTGICIAGEGGRADTFFKLENSGTITIKSASGKSLVLPGDAIVEFANMPMEWLTDLTAASTGAVPHFQVYCDMTGNTNCPQSPGRVNADKCGQTAFIMRPSQQRVPGGGGSTDPQYAADVFCSNSHWP